MDLEIVHEKVPAGYEEIASAKIGPKKLKAIIAIHNTVLGPALGGVRMFPYKLEKEAVNDVLRLSRGMTHKASVAGLNLGGGKAVIMGDPGADRSDELWHDFGRMVEGLKGRYITAEDVGTFVEDMIHVSAETKHVTGLPEEMGGNGDPSPVTALGVYSGIMAALEHRFGERSVRGKRIGIQGLGKVGYALAELLGKNGAILYVADIDEQRVRKAEIELKAIPIDINEIYSVGLDVLSPCALGAIINSETIPKIKAPIIAGAANNQLADEEEDSKRLEVKSILYAPDFVINAGGLITVAGEVDGFKKEEAMKRAEKIYDTMLKVFEKSKKDGTNTTQAAIRLAEDRIMQKAEASSPYPKAK